MLRRVELDGMGVGSTVGATVEPGENAAGSGTVWWFHAAKVTGPLTIDLSGSGFDTVVSVFEVRAGDMVSSVMDQLVSCCVCEFRLAVGRVCRCLVQSPS